MMTKIFMTWIAFLLGTLTTLHAQKHIVVIGEVKNIEEGTVFNLEETNGTGSSRRFSKDTPEDNGKVINGHFVLDHKCNNPASRHFALYSNSPGFIAQVKLDFWAEQGDTIYVKGNGKILGNWEVQTQATEQKEWDFIRRATAKECKAYQQAWLDYEAYRQYRRDTEMSEAEWDRTKAILAQKETLKQQNHILWLKSQLIAMKKLPVTDFWMDQLGTIIHFASNIRRESLEEPIKKLYIQNAGQIDRKPDGKAVREWVYPSPKAEIGKPCVDSNLFDVNGIKHRLADFRGKYVLLDFWANYCGPCIAAFPHIGKIQEQYTDQLTIVSISVDKVDTWKNSPHQKSITWYSLNDGGGSWGGIAKSYNIMATPTYILIAPDGTYQARLTSADIYNGNLEKQLKK